MFFVFLMKIPN